MSKMAKRASVCLLIGLLSMFAVACGDDGGSGGGGGGSAEFDSGVEKSKQADQISDDEQQSLCSAYEDMARSQFTEQELKEFSCTFAGMFAAAFSNPSTDQALQQACATARDGCLQGDGSSGGSGSGEDDTPEVCEIPDGCTATIAEIETCEEARVAQTKKLMAEMPACEELTLADMNQEGGETVSNEPPAECQPVKDKCPGYFDDSSTGQ